ncbi:MAG: hypothetical protein NUV86_08290, partial [Candidatus Scalindua sp.]|nr:hypothetical protein [Candidatus Scalindua sp.]
LTHILTQKESVDSVIVLPPSGLRDNYWRVVKKNKGIVVVLTDNAQNILNRIKFFDIDSKPINKQLTDEGKKYYLKDIKKDITYFNRTYKKADISVNISGLNPDQASMKVKKTLENL